MSTNILDRIKAYDQDTHETVIAILEAEDALMSAFMTGVLSFQDYTQARDYLDLRTGIDVPAADARATARRTVAFCAERRAAKQQMEATS